MTPEELRQEMLEDDYRDQQEEIQLRSNYSYFLAKKCSTDIDIINLAIVRLKQQYSHYGYEFNLKDILCENS